MKDKPNLDLMRAYAVLLVVLDHLFLAQNMQVVAHRSMAWLGTAGVYIFFVHTSLVLMWSLERKPHTLDFYIRRAFRIYPLAMVVVALTLIFHAPIGGTIAHYFAYQAPAGLHGILYNLLLLQYAVDSPSVMGVLWSLPLEIGMYVFLPAFFFFYRRSRTVWFLLFLWFFSAIVAGGLTSNGNIFPTVVPCFLPGVMAYVLFRRVRPILPAWLFPIFLLALTALFLRQPKVERSWPFCLALGLCLPFFLQVEWSPIRFLSHQIAKYSYGIYLTHTFAIVMGFYLLHNSSALVKVVATFSSLAIFSFAAYWIVEKPMIDVGRRAAAHAERYFESHIAT